METKFNFSEEASDLKKEAVKRDARGLWISVSSFLRDLLDFRDDTDKEATLLAIKQDIPMKGATAWILICSIFVASVGLNANATAVVIGAMLISPLMGPILGIGLSIAIHDIDSLKKSLINFFVMVVLSVLTAYLFFALFPLREESSELLARTRPDIRDVLIAFFGGLALIIARTKKGTIASVIFGVAIATALMPPLCTVGFGLAEGNFEFAVRALYLFTINTIFIALATYLVVKVLRFPMIKYANSKRRRFIANTASVVAVLVMIPATYTFLDVLKESRFKAAAKSFLKQELKGLSNAYYLEQTAEILYEEEGQKIVLNTFGQDPLPESTIALLRSKLSVYPPLETTALLFNQQKRENDFRAQKRYMEELRTRDSLDLMNQTQKIVMLEEKIAQLSALEAQTIPFESISREAKVIHENLEKLAFANTLVSNFEKIDTLMVFTARWQKDLSNDAQETERQKLLNWLQFKLPNTPVILNNEALKVE